MSKHSLFGDRVEIPKFILFQLRDYMHTLLEIRLTFVEEGEDRYANIPTTYLHTFSIFEITKNFTAIKYALWATLTLGFNDR